MHRAVRALAEIYERRSRWLRSPVAFGGGVKNIEGGTSRSLLPEGSEGPSPLGRSWRSWPSGLEICCRAYSNGKVQTPLFQLVAVRGQVNMKVA